MGGPDTESLWTPTHLQPLAEDALEVLSGPEDGRLFPLAAPVATIGRLPSSDVALALDASVSRTHARIIRDETDGDYFVEDLGSTHGTFVGGQQIHSRTQLRPGDELLVGSTLLRLRRKAGG